MSQFTRYLLAAATEQGVEILGIPSSQFLGLSVIAAFVGFLGSLVGIFIKDFWLANWFEKRRSRTTIEDVYRRYQLPIFLAADELSGRFYGLSRKDSEHLKRDSKFGLDQIRAKPSRSTNATVDPHYLRYRFLSNAYRLCSFLGWLELYRRDVGTMDIDVLGVSRKLDTVLKNIQSILADGYINKRKDWNQWRDCLLFREELRAIGSRMIADKDKLAILDFGTFSEIVEADIEGEGLGRWFLQAALLFDYLSPKKDFRLVRMRMLVVHLTDLMELLQPGRLPRRYIEGAKELEIGLDEMAGSQAWRGREFVL